MTQIQQLNDARCLPVYLSSKAASSRRVLASSLGAIAALVDESQTTSTFMWSELRYEHTSVIRMLLAQKVADGELSPATVNRHLSALRGILKTAWRLQLMPAEDYQRAIDVASLKYQSLPAGRVLSAGELDKLFRHCMGDESPTMMRDAALLVLLRSGARRQEVVDLDVADVNLVTGAVHIRSGKGNKSRITYFPQSLCPIAQRWIDLRGRRPGPFLHPVRKGGSIQRGDRLTAQSVLFLLGKLQTELQLEELSPHDFRRTFITQLAEAGVDATTAQRLSGHADARTHQLYDRRGEDVKQQAVQHLHVTDIR